MRILVADDDVVSRVFVEEALGKDHEITAVANGVDAWGFYQLSMVDVMVIDAMMPELDGFEICRRVRAAGRKTYTYIIMLTSLKGSDEYVKGMDAGADDFVTKPVGVRELQVRVHVAERVLGLQERVEKLEGLLPMCGWCKRIRSADDEWLDVESYVQDLTEAALTHGICPTCAAKHMKTG